MRRRPVFLILVMCACLGACSKSESPKPEASKAPAKASAEAPKPPSPPPEPKPTGPVVSGKGMPGASFGARVCAGVKKTLPKVNDQTPVLDVTTLFATEIVSAFLDAPLELNDKMRDMDAAATADCPAERTKLLPLLQKANLADAFLNPQAPAQKK